jgi:hypothetical protein
MIEFTGEYEESTERVFTEAYRRALTKSIEYIFSKCFEYAPVGKTAKGAVNLRNALMYEVYADRGEGYIGLPKDSELENIGFWTEIGTGERGSQGWQMFYQEKKPHFTIPIRPLRAKAMHFVNEKGEDIFMKTSKGQRPQAYMRRGFKDSELIVKKIWENEFSGTNIEKLLKMKKVNNI